MKQWEIFSFDFPGDIGRHPAVIVSSQARVERGAMLNVLLCSSHRATRPAKPFEVILDESDGLDWQTLCRCDLFFVVSPEELFSRRGIVGLDRRRAIVNTILRSCEWDRL